MSHSGWHRRSARVWRARLCAIACGVSLLRSAAAETAESPSGSAAVALLLDRGRQRYDRGVLDENDAELAAALDAFALAYGLWPEPELLFNMGQVERMRARCGEARQHYEAYLARSASTAPRRRLAELHLTALADCRAAPLASLAPAPGVPPQLALPDGPAVLDGAPPLPPPAAEQSSSSNETLSWALAAAAAGTAIATGVFVAQAWNADTDAERARTPQQLSRAVSTGERAQLGAWSFGALTLGLGASAVLSHVLSRPAAADPALEPRLELGIDPEGAAWASWVERF